MGVEGVYHANFHSIQNEEFFIIITPAASSTITTDKNHSLYQLYNSNKKNTFESSAPL